MQNLIYLYDSYCSEIETTVRYTTTIRDSTAIALEDVIFRPKGGGQPRDHGHISIDDKMYQVSDIIKQKGDVLVIISAKIPDGKIVLGQKLKCVLDWKRRYSFMRLHTGGHILMASLRKIIVGFQSKGITINDDCSVSTIKFVTEQKLTKELIQKIADTANQAVGQKHKVMVRTYDNIEEASLENEKYFRIDPDLHLEGKIRVITIENLDANPCSGTHLNSLGEINMIKIEETLYLHGNGGYELRYVVN